MTSSTTLPRNETAPPRQASRATPAGSFCPVDPDHGPVYLLSSGATYCPHVAHAGRPSTHPDGAAPPTQSVFRPEVIA